LDSSQPQLQVVAKGNLTGRALPIQIAPMESTNKVSDRPHTSASNLHAGIFEQIRAAQRWFAYAGSDSNGASRLVASAPGQKFSFVAESSGVEVKPWSKSIDWSWRMAPRSLLRVAPKAERERVIYDRGNGITEWFTNGDQGIEQGFTLGSANGETVRRMPLEVSTSLHPRLRPNADGVEFVDENGNAQLHYAGLKAFDAMGQPLPAWIELNETSNPLKSGASYELVLAANTADAVFPVTIDPVISLGSERIAHPELAVGDLFGVTLAANGSLIAIGAPKHSVGPVPNAGVVYLFIRDNNCDEQWSLLQKIPAPSPYNNGQFGRSLSLGANALAISAHRVRLANGADILEDVVYVLQPSVTNLAAWIQCAVLAEPDPNVPTNPTNYFGYALSMNAQGSLLAVGSPLSWSEGGNFPFRTGKVFIYGRDTGGERSWGFVRNLQPPLFVPNAGFGRGVAMDGARLAIGAPGYFLSNTNGSVFVYEHPSSGSLELPAPTLPGGLSMKGFGESIAYSDGHLAVGAPAGGKAVAIYERRVNVDPNSGLTTISFPRGILYAPDINPAQPGIPWPGSKFGEILSLSFGSLAVGWNSGATAFPDEDEDEPQPVPGLETLVCYEHLGDTNSNPAMNWKQEAPVPAQALSLRGIANAAVAGNLLVASSTNENYGSGIFDFGAAVAMRRMGGTWQATHRFYATPPTANNDLAGTSVAISDDLLVAGAPGYDAAGISDSGAVHIFRRHSGLPPSTNNLAHGWTLAATLINETPQINGRLGESVAIADGLIIAGAPGRNNAGGTVWIWKRAEEQANAWAGHVVLGAPGGLPGWRFGSALSFNGSTLAVGSPFAGGGRVHLFHRGTTNLWPVLQTLEAHATDARFGAALDLDEADNLIVGSPDNSLHGPGSGEAYIYRRDNPTNAPVWIEEANPGSFINGAHAGASVAIDRGWAFVGAPGEVVDTSAPTRTGRVRVYRRNHTAGDPWEPAATLEIPISASGASQFGSAIALDEHTAVIGAPGETNAGSAYIYLRVPDPTGAWRYAAKLLDPCSAGGDGFGTALALQHDKVFVGVPHAAAIDGNTPGTVMLFERHGADWALLREMPQESSHHIGDSVAVSGDWMVIGSTGDWDVDDEGPSDAGQVYLLSRHAGTGGSWQVVNKVVRPLLPGGLYDADEDDFGRTVDISDRIFVAGSYVGAYTFEIQTDGQLSFLGRLGGSASDVGFGQAVAIHGQRVAVTGSGSLDPDVRGSLMLFIRTNEHLAKIGEVFLPTSWALEKRITSTAFGFGTAVDLSDTTVVVSAPGDLDLFNGLFGAVAVYERDQGGLDNWGMTAYLVDPDVFGDENHIPSFGVSLSLEGDTLAVGSWLPGNAGNSAFGMGSVFQRHAGGYKQWGKVATVGGPVVAVNGDFIACGMNMPVPRSDEVNDGSFRYVEVFHRNAGGPDQWRSVQQISPPNPNRAHTWNFGASVALDGSTLAIGAPGEQRTATDWTPGRAFTYDLPLNLLQIWKDTHFAEKYFGDLTTMSGESTASLGDPDLDGIPNAWEAYQGLNPLIDDAALAGLKVLGINLQTSELIVRWREGLDPQGLSVRLQWSRSLGTWYDSGQGPAPNDIKTATINIVQTALDHVIKEARLPLGADDKLFTRLTLIGL